MNTQTLTNTANIFRNTLAAAMLFGATAAQAELQPNTIYVNTSTGLYAVDETAGTATQVAEMNMSFGNVQDIDFQGNDLYGLSNLMQFFKYDAATNMMVSTNGYTSYGRQHYGLANHNGTFYAAENHGLETVDPETSTFVDYVGPYGLGAGETVTDLASSADGNLYASVDFNITYGSEYLATLNPGTGEMNLIGSTYISGLRGLTEKDGVLYAISSVGDLYTIDKVSGLGTLIASEVVPGAYGMATSPQFTAAGNGGGEGGSSGGAMSWLLLMLVPMLALMRRVSMGSRKH